MKSKYIIGVLVLGLVGIIIYGLLENNKEKKVMNSISNNISKSIDRVSEDEIKAADSSEPAAEEVF